MTKRYEKVGENYEYKHTVCDGCGAILPEPKPGTYYACNITYQTGTQFVDDNGELAGASISGWRLPDLCDDCADVVLQLFVHHGFHVDSVDIDI